MNKGKNKKSKSFRIISYASKACIMLLNFHKYQKGRGVNPQQMYEGRRSLHILDHASGASIVLLKFKRELRGVFVEGKSTTNVRGEAKPGHAQPCERSEPRALEFFHVLEGGIFTVALLYI